MIRMTLILIVSSIVAFFIFYRLQIRYRLYIAVGILLIPLLTLMLFLNIIGDKPAGSSYRYYSGPQHIDLNEEYEKTYNSLLEEGRQYEKKKLFDAAINKYRVAVKVDRVVVPSYYALFDIGRAQYEAGKLNDAFKTFEDYLYNVEMELRPSQEAANIPNGGFMVSNQTAESAKALLSNKEKAEEYIKNIQADRRFSGKKSIK